MIEVPILLLVIMGTGDLIAIIAMISWWIEMR